LHTSRSSWQFTKPSEAVVQRERAERAEFEAISNLLESKMAYTDLNLKSRRPVNKLSRSLAIRDSIELARQTNTLDDTSYDCALMAISALARVDLSPIRSVIPSEASTFFSFTADFSKVAFRVRDNNQNFVTIALLKDPIRNFNAFHFHSTPGCLSR
jgi:hypothetical protein